MDIERKENENEIKISPATPEDVRGATEVYYKTWLATYPNEAAGITVDDVENEFKDTFTEEGLAQRTKRMVHPAENTSFFLAKDGDKVVGVCSVIRHPDKNELRSIYVLPENQGKGVGTLLWQEAQRYFDVDKDITVEVVSYNSNAIEFYRKLGFQKIDKEGPDETFKLKSGVYLPETEMVIKAMNKS